MTQPKYMLCFSEETGTQGVILYCLPPFFLGKILIYESELAYLNAIGKAKAINLTSVTGYTILIEYAGTLDNRNVPVDGTIGKLLEDVFMGMADFYLKEKINKKPSFFSRYKLIKNVKPGSTDNKRDRK